MGNDGGSIPKRRELVKNASRLPTVSELKATALESLAHAWTADPITSNPMDMENIVSDWRGRLYNYETILSGLIPGDDAQETGGDPDNPGMTFSSTGIKSLRDVVKLKFKRYTPPGAKEKPVWACPVSLKELGPVTKSVYLVPCGHVFAEAAIKEIQEPTCPECSEPFERDNVIPILETESSELERLQQRIDDLKASGLTHSLKKDKSNSKKKRKAGEKDSEDRDHVENQKKGRPTKKDTASRVSGINNAMTASLTAKVLAEQEERNKRRKLTAVR